MKGMGKMESIKLVCYGVAAMCIGGGQGMYALFEAAT